MGLGESKKELRTTWIGFTVIFGLFGSISLYKHGAAWPYMYGISAGFAFFAAFAPFALMPLYRLWVKFATFMAFVNTRLLLGLVFYGVVTPIGRLMQWSGKDILDERIDRSAASYWKKRTPRQSADEYFRQY